MKLSLIASVLMLLPTPSQAEILPVDVDLVVTQGCSSGFCQQKTVRVCGTGTVIGHTPNGRYAVIVTAGHLFRDGKVKSIWVDGKVAQHYQFVANDQDDIGITFVEAPPVRWTPTPLADDEPTLGEPVTLSGYVGTETAATDRPGQVVDPKQGYASMPADEGLSGGPILTKRRTVVGVCTHDSGYVDKRTKERIRQTRFTPTGRIRTFMRSRSITVGIVQPPMAPLPPAEAPINAVRQKPTESSPPQIVSKPDTSALETRLASIEQKIAAIPQGPPGPAGPAGPEGNPGVAGPQGPAGVVTVILKDSSGNVVDTHTDIASGSTVTIPVKRNLKAPSPPS